MDPLTFLCLASYEKGHDFLREAKRQGCFQVTLTTTNDNIGALRFYQRRGFRLAALRTGAVDRSRQRKPEIPRTGDFGIPLRDEIDLTCPI